jgi:peptidyl-prolyl cis-trans isomerase C
MRHLLLLLTLPTLLACNRPERPHPQGPGMTPDAAAAQVEQVPNVRKIDKTTSLLTAEQRAVVVAQIGEHAITLGEFEARLALEPPVVRSQFASVQKRKDYLQKLVQFEVLAAEARRQGLDKDPEVLEAMKQAMIRKYLQEVGQQEVQPSAVPEAELRAYYDANVGLYHKPEQVDVSHMLFKTEAQARKVADELKAGAEGNAGKLVATWNDYVVRLSEDKSTAPYLGALGPVSRTVPPGASEAEVQRQQAVPQGVIEAAFAMKPFEVGPVVHSPQGWHVLMVTSRSPAVDKSFEDVKDSIRARVVKRERDLRRQQLIESLRTNAKVTVNDEALRLITIQPPEPTGKGKGLAHEATPEHGETEDLAP